MTKVTKAQRNYIYVNYEQQSVEQIAQELGIKPGEVSEIVQAILKAKENKPKKERLSQDIGTPDKLSPFARLMYKTPVAILALILLTLLAFMKSFSVPQHFVDREVYKNVKQQDIRKIMGEMLAPVKGIYKEEARAHLFEKAPVKILYAMDFKISEKLGVPVTKISHITNIIIHLSIGIILFMLVRLTVTLMWPHVSLRFRDWIAPSVALFFLVFPSNADAITYLSGRYYSFPTLLFMAAIFCYAMSRLSLKYFGVYFGLLLVILYLGITTTECFILFPFIALAYDLVCLREQESELRLLAGLDYRSTNSFRVIFYTSLVMCGAAFVMYLKWRNQVDPEIKLFSLYTDAWLYPGNIIIGAIGGTAICYLFYLLEKGAYSKEPGLFVVMGSLTVIITLCFITNRENTLWNSPRDLWLNAIYNDVSEDAKIASKYNEDPALAFKENKNLKLEPKSVAWGKAMFFLGKTYDELADQAKEKQDYQSMNTNQLNAYRCYDLAKEAYFTPSRADLKILYEILKGQIEWFRRERQNAEVIRLVQFARKTTLRDTDIQPFAKDPWLLTMQLEFDTAVLAQKKLDSPDNRKDAEKQAKELLDELKKLALAAPDNLNQQLALGQAYLLLRNISQTREDCSKLVESIQKKWRKDYTAQDFAARFHAMTGRFDEAKNIFQQMRSGKSQSEQAKIFYREGLAFDWVRNNNTESGQALIQSMIGAFEKAKELEPKNSDYLKTLGTANMLTGASIRAESLLIEAQKIREEQKLSPDPEIDFKLGELAYRLQKKEQALKNFETCWDHWKEQRHIYISRPDLAQSILLAGQIAKELKRDKKETVTSYEKFLRYGPPNDMNIFKQLRKELKELGADMKDVDNVLTNRGDIDVSFLRAEESKEEKKVVGKKLESEPAPTPVQ